MRRWDASGNHQLQTCSEVILKDLKCELSFLQTLISPPKDKDRKSQLAPEALEDRSGAFSLRPSSLFLYIMVSTIVWVGAFIRRPLLPLGSSGKVSSLGPRWSTGRELAPPRTGAATALILCRREEGARCEETGEAEMTQPRMEGKTVLKFKMTCFKLHIK